MTVDPIPTTYEGVTPYLVVKDTRHAIDFYTAAFDAEVVMRLTGPRDVIVHADLRIGNGHIMLTEENAEAGWKSPRTVGGNPVTMVIYVDDVDTTFKRALDAGATEFRPVKDQFYGDRSGTLNDPFGHIWTLATRKEDLTGDQIQARMAKTMEGEAG